MMLKEKNQAFYTIFEENDDQVEIEEVEVPFDREKMEYSIQHAELVNEDIKQYTLTR